jgi:hypothetical protein
LCVRIIQRVIWSGRKRVNWQTRTESCDIRTRATADNFVRARAYLSRHRGVEVETQKERVKCALKLCDAAKRSSCCPRKVFVLCALWRELLFERRSSIEIYRPPAYGLKILFFATTLCKYFSSSTKVCTSSSSNIRQLLIG